MEIATAPRLYAYTGGRPFDPAKPVVVFLHGAQHDHSVWILQSRYLAHHGSSVLALDLPGHGRSEGPPLPTIEAIADRVADALRASAVTRMIAVGQSMGSLIALELARRMPAETCGIALVASTFPMRVADALLQATRDAPAAALDMINVWSHSPSIAGFDRKPAAPGPGFSNVWQNLRLMQRIERRGGPDVLPIDFAACNGYTAGLETAAALRCPVLFVLGTADSMTPPRTAKGLIDACRDAQVVTVPGGGHALMAERPDGVREALVAFAKRVLAPTG